MEGTGWLAAPISCTLHWCRYFSTNLCSWLKTLSFWLPPYSCLQYAHFLLCMVRDRRWSGDLLMSIPGMVTRVLYLCRRLWDFLQSKVYFWQVYWGWAGSRIGNLSCQILCQPRILLDHIFLIVLHRFDICFSLITSSSSTSSTIGLANW